VARGSPIASPAVRRAALVALGAALIALTGCGTAENGNFDRGRQLFVAKCGTCHTLKQAATTGTQGPDLDAAFAQARAAGMDPDTIAGVVRAQVDNPRPTTADPNVSMPPHLVSGDDLSDVANYVAHVAGVKGIQPPTFTGGPGGQVFGLNGCGSCHTLKAAGTTGTTGPDLDKVLPGMSAAQVEQSIVNPNAKITPGYPPNTMPQTFGQTINPKDLKVLVNFLLSSTKGG
jgi:mono/diheme cytochrome c family protein